MLVLYFLISIISQKRRNIIELPKYTINIERHYGKMMIKSMTMSKVEQAEKRNFLRDSWWRDNKWGADVFKIYKLSLHKQIY